MSAIVVRPVICSLFYSHHPTQLYFFPQYCPDWSQLQYRGRCRVHISCTADPTLYHMLQYWGCRGTVERPQTRPLPFVLVSLILSVIPTYMLKVIYLWWMINLVKKHIQKNLPPQGKDGEVLNQEAKYVESWPNTTSAWAGWSRFDIPVDRSDGVHSLLQCTWVSYLPLS